MSFEADFRHIHADTDPDQPYFDQDWPKALWYPLEPQVDRPALRASSATAFSWTLTDSATKRSSENRPRAVLILEAEYLSRWAEASSRRSNHIPMARASPAGNMRRWRSWMTTSWMMPSPSVTVMTRVGAQPKSFATTPALLRWQHNRQSQIWRRPVKAGGVSTTRATGRPCAGQTAHPRTWAGGPSCRRHAPPRPRPCAGGCC